MPKPPSVWKVAWYGRAYQSWFHTVCRPLIQSEDRSATGLQMLEFLQSEDAQFADEPAPQTPVERQQREMELSGTLDWALKSFCGWKLLTSEVRAGGYTEHLRIPRLPETHYRLTRFGSWVKAQPPLTRTLLFSAMHGFSAGGRLKKWSQVPLSVAGAAAGGAKFLLHWPSEKAAIAAAIAAASAFLVQLTK